MSRTVMMSELSWPEYKRRLEEENAIILLPVGAVEQHGYHLPLGTDWILATEMSRRAAERVGGIVAPPVMYAYKSQVRTGGGNHFCGTTSLDGTSLIAMVRDVIKEFARHGARKIAVIDGHYENEFFLTEACDVAIRDLRYDGITDIKILKMRYCEEITDEAINTTYPNGYPGLSLEHGAVFETSMMLYCFPHLVDVSRISDDPPAQFPPYDLYPAKTDRVPPSGSLSPAHGSSAEIGRMLVEEFTDLVSRALEAEFRSTGAAAVRAAS
jgi:creatinine amidohydrolase